MKCIVTVIVALLSAAVGAYVFGQFAPHEEIQRPDEARAAEADATLRRDEMQRLDAILALLRDRTDVKATIDELRLRLDSRAPAAGGPDDGAQRRHAELLDRLEKLEETLARLLEKLDARTDGTNDRLPAMKAKDAKLLAELSSRGQADRKLNSRDFFALTPRDVCTRLGPPDSTQVDEKTGALDWFYFGPEERGAQRYGLEGGAVQVRFVAGVVSAVFP